MTAIQDKLELTFEDNPVETVAVRITNAGDGLSDALEVDPKILHLDDEIAFVLRGRVTQVNHKKVLKDGEKITTRVHTVSATGITEVELSMAKKILDAAAENLEKARAARDGQLMLDAENEALAREEND